MPEKYVAKFTNANVDAGNYQLVDFDFLSTQVATVPETVARIVAYFAYIQLVGTIANDTYLDSVSYRASGDPGATDQPFPSAEYAALVTAADGDGITIPALTDGYGTPLGDGFLAPLGTSVSVSERTVTVGPTGRGRHFLPFISTGSIAANGSVGPAHLAGIQNAYGWFLMPASGDYVTEGGDTVPVVTNAAGSHEYPIVLVKAQPIYSNLESRRR